MHFDFAQCEQRGFTQIHLLVLGVIVLLIGAGVFMYSQNKLPFVQKPSQQACTQDAKLCPDGSYVGRVGPNCEFTVCPTISDETANWKTYTNKEFGYSLSYPVDYRLEERSSVYLKKGSDSNLDNIIEIYTEGQWITNDKNMSSISFEDFAVEVLKIRCFADGANGSQYCDKAIKKSPITNKNNLRGYEIYLERIFERYEDGQTKKSSSIDGPFFVFDISKENNGLARGLFIINDYGQPDAENEKMLREIIDTLKF